MTALQWRKEFNTATRESVMKAWSDLLSTDYGLMSLAVILVVVFMSIWFSRFFTRHMNEDAAAAARAAQSAKQP
jgi:heme/copper-type cytochrome/quinol oxidase subunit 2